MPLARKRPRPSDYGTVEGLRQVLLNFQKRNQMKNPQDAAKLAALTEFIDSYYGGQLDEMIRQLHETIYMLHYLDTELFGEEKRLEKVFLLYCIAECLQTETEVKPLPE